jgi:hypothetical protein
MIHNTVPRHYVQGRIDDGAEEVGAGGLWEMLVSIARGVEGRSGRLSVGGSSQSFITSPEFTKESSFKFVLTRAMRVLSANLSASPL